MSRHRAGRSRDEDLGSELFGSGGVGFDVVHGNEGLDEVRRLRGRGPDAARDALRGSGVDLAAYFPAAQAGIETRGLLRMAWTGLDLKNGIPHEWVPVRIGFPGRPAGRDRGPVSGPCVWSFQAPGSISRALSRSRRARAMLT